MAGKMSKVSKQIRGLLSIQYNVPADRLRITCLPLGYSQATVHGIHIVITDRHESPTDCSLATPHSSHQIHQHMSTTFDESADKVANRLTEGHGNITIFLQRRQKMHT